MIIRGDCVEAMRDLQEASFDAVCTDPPYGLEFMGKEWDRLAGAPGYNERGRMTPESSGLVQSKGFNRIPNSFQAGQPMQDWHHAWATECLRVLKPGGHLLAFGGTRTYHRLACAIEDAGFEIRDCLAWMYGSGFPKSLDVSKALDRAAGVEREDVYEYKPRVMDNHVLGTGLGVGVVERNPVTEAARQWQGWGTALKPAHEPIVLARKPLTGTVAQNVERYGCGALNIDGTRVEAAENDRTQYGLDGNEAAGIGYHGLEGRTAYERPEAGRWPSNVLLDEPAAELLDEQSGESTSPPVGSTAKLQRPASAHTVSLPPMELPNGYGDSGGASRFFYTSKASRAERNAGLEGFAERENVGVRYTTMAGDGRPEPAVKFVARANHHPTVKPIDLMRWLCRLVTPPGGHVLDPFAGSGTTGIACVLEGFTFTGIEREAEYADIAEARIAYWTEHGEKALLAMYEAERRRVVSETGQLAMSL